MECWQQASETSGQWAPCGNATTILPKSRDLTATAVNITGLQPHLDYKLVVRAGNAVGSSAHTTTTIQKCECGRIGIWCCQVCDRRFHTGYLVMWLELARVAGCGD